MRSHFQLKNVLIYIFLVANWIITPGSSLNQRCLKHFAESPFDAAFIGATAIAEDGVYFSYMEDAQVKQAAALSARRVVVVSETEKFQIEAPYRGLELGQITTLITDKKLSRTHKQWFAPQTQFLLGD